MKLYSNGYDYAMYTTLKYYKECYEDKCLAGYQSFCTL